MDALWDFLDMGGYALWVWSSYGVVTALLVGLVANTVRASRKARRSLDALKAERRGGH